MITILKLLPCIPLFVLSYLLVISFIAKRNKNIEEVRGDIGIKETSKLKKQLIIINDKIYEKTNDNVKNLFDKQMDWLIKHGNRYNLNIFTYYLTKLPGAIFLIFAFKIDKLLPRIIFIILAIMSFIYIEFKYVDMDKEDSIEIRKDLFKIYNQIDVMSYGDITIKKALVESVNVIKNKRFLKAYMEMTATIVETKDIVGALEDLNKKFNMSELDSFVTTITQGIETGKVREMVASQRKIINKRYLATKDIETENKQSKVFLGEILLFVSIIGIVMYSFLTTLVEKLQGLF